MFKWFKKRHIKSKKNVKDVRYGSAVYNSWGWHASGDKDSQPSWLNQLKIIKIQILTVIQLHLPIIFFHAD